MLGPLVLAAALLGLFLQRALPTAGGLWLPAAVPLRMVSAEDLYGPLRRAGRPVAQGYRQGRDYEQASLPALTPDGPQLFLTRWLLASLLAALLLTLARWPGACLDRLRAALLQPEPAVNLAVFRLLVFALPLLLRWDAPPLFLTHYLEAPGVNFSYGWLPPPEALGEAACRLLEGGFLAACAAASAGLATRWSAPLATLLGLYVLGVPALFHGGLLNHLVWFFALLSVSRCADVLSLDARLGRAGPDRGSSLAYGVPLRLAALILGSILLMPGFWKLWNAGFQWGTAENLDNWMYFYWHVYHVLPPLRPDHWPWLCGMAAAAVLVIQVSEAGLMLSDRFRVAAAYLMVGLLFGITVYMVRIFWNLLACVALMADWRWLRPATVPPANGPEAPPRAPLVVAAVVLAGNLWCGLAFAQRTWPWSMYPSFANLAPPVKQQLVARDAQGRRFPLSSGRFFNSSRWEVYLRQLAAMPAEQRGPALNPLIRRLTAISPAEVDIELIWTQPERRDWPPLASVRLDVP